MNLKDIENFQFKRINPFPGLAIDADTWRDAHNYNRDQQRLHNLVFHEVGIIQGLQVTQNEPADLSMNIHPGIALDPQGNIIFVRNEYHYQIQNREKKTVYLIIQFREILEGPYQPPEGGQPTRIADGYRIQERDSLPNEPYLELARIELDPSEGVIKNAENTASPGKNEINSSFRREVITSIKPVTSKPAFTDLLETFKPDRKIAIGYVLVNGDKNEQHVCGLRNLTREIEMRYNWKVDFEENVALDKNISRYNMIYLTGGDHFKLNSEQKTALESFLKSDGLLVAEDCSRAESRRLKSKNSTPVYNELKDTFSLKLKPVGPGNPLLSNINVFSKVPQGVRSGVFLNEGNIIYTDNDYGCAWHGGHKGNPLSREVIRNAFEIGMNLIEYAVHKKTPA